MDDDDESYEAELAEAVEAFCPYCGETVELSLDPGGGGLQEYVEDCHVCCRPWAVRATIAPDGTAAVEITTLDDPF